MRDLPPQSASSVQRAEMLDLLLGVLLTECNAADESGDDAQWEHLDGLCARAKAMLTEDR